MLLCIATASIGLRSPFLLLTDQNTDGAFQAVGPDSGNSVELGFVVETPASLGVDGVALTLPTRVGVGDADLQRVRPGVRVCGDVEREGAPDSLAALITVHPNFRRDAHRAQIERQVRVCRQ